MTEIKEPRITLEEASEKFTCTRSEAKLINDALDAYPDFMSEDPSPPAGFRQWIEEVTVIDKSWLQQIRLLVEANTMGLIRFKFLDIVDYVEELSKGKI